MSTDVRTPQPGDVALLDDGEYIVTRVIEGCVGFRRPLDPTGREMRAMLQRILWFDAEDGVWRRVGAAL